MAQSNQMTTISPLSIDKISIDKNNKNVDSDIEMPLRDGKEFIVQSSMISKWKEASMQINIDNELKKMTAWLIRNPSKQKTWSGMNKFINNWLSRNNDKIEASSVSSTKLVNKTQSIQPSYSEYVEEENTSGGSLNLQEWYDAKSEENDD